ncbi:unnamed protein product [Ilex paraguariensis]|uniref:AB hydrolase-1 domain-containing protein n=1 Tax=Ilex paraguariensis TaxID=185542 RepID=A0ABC8S060_9AQUA
MVNVFTVAKPLLQGLMKLAGMTPKLVEIEPGTLMNFWVPNETIQRNQNQNQNHTNHKTNKPAVVLVHGFFGDGVITWLFQVLALTGRYAVYVPDLLFFGGSTTDSHHRSTVFQAECLAKGLRKLGVESCTLVGFSYGGIIGFKLAKLDPDLVESLVVSATVVELTESISRASLQKIGFSQWSELLLPETVEGVKAMLTVGTHKLPWLPDFLYRNFLEVMFINRKERTELLEAFIDSDKDATATTHPQRIHLLWGDNDKLFDLEVAHNIKEQLGGKSTLHYIEKAGHLVGLERPFMYTRHLKRILASLDGERLQKMN